MNNFFHLILWIAISFIPGIFGGRFKPGTWYATLPRPPWTPPNLAFPIVWTILYILIGIASSLVFRHGLADRHTEFALFLIQLILNGLWSWIFFGIHKIGWALVDLILLWCVALIMLKSFWDVSPLAGGLLIPYQLWLTIAISLNGYIYLYSATSSRGGSKPHES